AGRRGGVGHLLQSLRSPLIFFLRVSLRRGSASRFGCPSLHASNPRAYARRSFSSFASRFGAARQVASAAPRFTPRNPAPTLAAHFLPSRLASARLGKSLPLRLASPLETPRLPPPLPFFLRRSPPPRPPTAAPRASRLTS